MAGNVELPEVPHDILDEVLERVPRLGEPEKAEYRTRMTRAVWTEIAAGVQILENAEETYARR